jgi:hypothetical protein
MWERVLDLSELSRLQPPAPLISFMCAARRGPTTKSWLAPPIRARDQAGRQRPSLWPLDARWGQSNTTFRHNVYVSWEPGPDGFELEAVQRMDERTCMKQQLCVV